MNDEVPSWDDTLFWEKEVDLSFLLKDVPRMEFLTDEEANILACYRLAKQLGGGVPCTFGGKTDFAHLRVNLEVELRDRQQREAERKVLR